MNKFWQMMTGVIISFSYMPWQVSGTPMSTLHLLLHLTFKQFCEAANGVTCML